MPPLTSPLSARPGPRWSIGVALTLVVLGAHLVLLADGLPSWAAHPPAASAAGLPTASAVVPQTSASDAARSRPAAVLTSQVRWIAPPAVQPPAAAQPEPFVPVTAVPQPKPRPAPVRVSAPLETERLAAVQQADPVPTPPAVEQPPAMPADPVSSPTDVSDAPPEFASEVPLVTDNGVQLAQATAQQKPASTSIGPANQADAPLGPAQPPASAQLRYSIEGQSKGIHYSATGSLDWRNEGSIYGARMGIRVFLLGSRVQTSQGLLASGGLQPERFGDKSRSERAAHFDRSQNRIRFSNNAPDAELLPGTQDRLSVFLQLAGLLNARPEAFVVGQSIDIPVAGTSAAEIWRFQVQDLTSLDLPAGSLIARHLVREPREPRDTRVDIWLAPSLGHLPVRIRLTQDNGDVVDQRLSSLP